MSVFRLSDRQVFRASCCEPINNMAVHRATLSVQSTKLSFFFCFEEPNSFSVSSPLNPVLSPVYRSGSLLLLGGLEPLCSAQFGTRQTFHAPWGRSGSSCGGWEQLCLTKGSLVWRDLSVHHHQLTPTAQHHSYNHTTLIPTHIQFTLQPHTLSMGDDKGGAHAQAIRHPHRAPWVCLYTNMRCTLLKKCMNRLLQLITVKKKSKRAYGHTLQTIYSLPAHISIHPHSITFTDTCISSPSN